MSQSTILVVDDDAAICRVLARVLTAEGYGVATAADGGSALVELERHTPDLVVLDIAMPGLDGLAVARRARAKGLSRADPDADGARRRRRSRGRSRRRRR